MMKWIVGSSLKFRFLVVAAGAAMVFVGVGQLRDSPVDVFPEFAQPRVEIQTISLGLNATEVESLVTVPLEQSLQGLPDVEIVRSKSVSGLSSIQLLFKRGTDILFSRQLVAERVGTVTPTLPTWAAPPTIVPPLSSTSRVMKIGLRSDTLSLMDMSVITYWKIRARLLQVPGVANVPIWGERLQQMQVHVDPQKLREYGISLDQVMDSTADSLDSGLLQFSEGSMIGTGGFIDTPNQRLTVQHVMPIVEPTDLASIPIEKQNGKQISVGDVADLVWGHQPLVGDAVINDGEGLMLIVEKLPWANTLDVTRGVEAALADMQPGLPGIEVDTTIFRPATFIEVSLDNLTKALLIGVLLVILVLIAFLFEWRAALISVLTIPLSLVAAGLVLHARGETINVMVLAGLVIALGVIVDDAIIDVQNITRRLRQHRRDGGSESTASVVLRASLEVRGPIVYATLIILAAVVPIFFLRGLTGAFFGPLALSYVLAVAASLVIALTVVAGAEPDSPVQLEGSRAPLLATRALARGRLRADSGADRHEAALGVSGLRPDPRGRRRGNADARAVAAPVLQGAGLPDALADGAGHLRRRGDADLGPRLQRAETDPRRPQLRLPHRAGVRDGRGRAARTSARTGSASTRRPTTTRRSRASRSSSTAIPGSTATCRRT